MSPVLENQILPPGGNLAESPRVWVVCNHLVRQLKIEQVQDWPPVTRLGSGGRPICTNKGGVSPVVRATVSYGPREHKPWADSRILIWPRVTFALQMDKQSQVYIPASCKFG
jgi:hypothetical protein